MDDGESRQIIEEEMRLRGLDPNDVHYKFKWQASVGVGEARCRCGRTWTSHAAHVVIDLVKQKVKKSYRQACKKCRSICDMEYSDQEFTRIVQDCIEKYIQKVAGTYQRPPRLGGGRGRPHESALCERCGFGTKPNCMGPRAGAMDDSADNESVSGSLATTMSGTLDDDNDTIADTIASSTDTLVNDLESKFDTDNISASMASMTLSGSSISTQTGSTKYGIAGIMMGLRGNPKLTTSAIRASNFKKADQTVTQSRVTEWLKKS